MFQIHITETWEWTYVGPTSYTVISIAYTRTTLGLQQSLSSSCEDLLLGWPRGSRGKELCSEGVWLALP